MLPVMVGLFVLNVLAWVGLIFVGPPWRRT
jgi:hypothetical protein